MSGISVSQAMGVRHRCVQMRTVALTRAIDSLARYKFQMFGYWAAQWVLLNRMIGDGEENPFGDFVEMARKRKVGQS